MVAGRPHDRFSRARGRGPIALYTIRPDGSRLTRIGLGVNAQWSPDGRHLAFDGLPGIVVGDPDGSATKVLFAQTAGNGPGIPAWSPDGRAIAFFDTPGRSRHFHAEVWTVNADGSAPRRLFRAPCCISSWAAPIWSPDGRLLAFAGSSGRGATYVMNADGRNRRRLASVAPSSLSWQRLLQK